MMQKRHNQSHRNTFLNVTKRKADNAIGKSSTMAANTAFFGKKPQGTAMDREKTGHTSLGWSRPAPIAHAQKLSLQNNKYTDKGGTSRKIIKFNATIPKKKNKKDYVIVNWLKGYMKDEKGNPFKVWMYGNLVNFNFKKWQVDSVDKDPAYWSKGKTRWRYTSTKTGFFATDNPNPPYWKDGVTCNVDFKVGLYKSKDVPKTTKGSMKASPIGSLLPWEFKATRTKGKITHP